MRTSSIIGVDGRDDTPPLHWDHIDSAKRLWTIPRVKNDDAEFVVPPSDAVMDILHDMRRKTRAKGLVFPGEPLSNNAMLSVFKRMNVKATAHGMSRASSRRGRRKRRHTTRI